jgi:sugar/nucleoside kinase (ribokinase family)
VGVDLVGVGQISLDHLATVDAMPAAGGKGVLDAMRRMPGGQVATALLAAQRLGLRCALVGAVGDDAAGAAALAPLRSEGVDVSGVLTLADVATRQAFVLVERGSGERTIFERRDPRLVHAPPMRPEAIEQARALLVDLEHPERAAEAVARAGAAGVPTLLDVDRVSPIALELVRQAEFPIVSEGFADELSSKTSHVQLLPELCGPRARLVVITRGARGSLAWVDGRVVETPARSVDVVDTTGAGDVFRGAFAWAWLAGHPPERILALANAAAAWSCQGLGAQGALPTRAQVEA